MGLLNFTNLRPKAKPLRPPNTFWFITLGDQRFECLTRHRCKAEIKCVTMVSCRAFKSLIVESYEPKRIFFGGGVWPEVGNTNPTRCLVRFSGSFGVTSRIYVAPWFIPPQSVSIVIAHGGLHPQSFSIVIAHHGGLPPPSKAQGLIPAPIVPSWRPWPLLHVRQPS